LNISVTVKHSLGVDEALARVRAHAEQLIQAFGDRITDVYTEWNGNILSCSFRVLGFIVLGTIAVGECEVIVDVTTPRLAILARSRILRRIREELETCLE
jgi:hypothetical protein